VPSSEHPNRDWQNWLGYDLTDQHLRGFSEHYRGTLYDLGCGTAPYKRFFLRYASEYVGVDWSESFHDSAADVVADLNQPLPLPESVADTVVSISVLEHLSRPQVMLGEAYRILKPGGSLILQVPFQWMVHEAPYDYVRYTPYGLEFMLNEAGFSRVTVEPAGGFFTMMVLKMNYFTGRRVRGPKPIRLILLFIFAPFWFAGQVVAPWLDRVDGDWSLETTGFWAVAHKGAARLDSIDGEGLKGGL